MLDAIFDLFGVLIEWLLHKLPKGCAILLGLALFVAVVVLIVWLVRS